MKMHSMLFSAAALLMVAACNSAHAPAPDSPTGGAPYYYYPGPQGLGDARWSRADSPGFSPAPRYVDADTNCAAVEKKHKKHKKHARKAKPAGKDAPAEKTGSAEPAREAAPKDKDAPAASGDKKSWWFK